MAKKEIFFIVLLIVMTISILTFIKISNAQSQDNCPSVECSGSGSGYGTTIKQACKAASDNAKRECNERCSNTHCNYDDTDLNNDGDYTDEGESTGKCDDGELEENSCTRTKGDTGDDGHSSIHKVWSSDREAADGLLGKWACHKISEGARECEEKQGGRTPSDK